MSAGALTKALRQLVDAYQVDAWKRFDLGEHSCDEVERLASSLSDRRARGRLEAYAKARRLLGLELRGYDSMSQR